jgi:phosphopantothenoylcysteine synthetase/decarboxylase
MLNKVFECMKSSDIFISCAAVVDFKPTYYSDTPKLKKKPQIPLKLIFKKIMTFLKRFLNNMTLPILLALPQKLPM